MAESNNWDFNIGNIVNFKDKRKSLNYYLRKMFNTSLRMFDYDNLPNTLPKRSLELMLQGNGWCAVPRPELTSGVVRAFSRGASLGGKPDIYYMPTQCIITNPTLPKSMILDIDKDVFIIRNDDMFLGLKPAYERYASLLLENDISLRMLDINTRTAMLISADTDKGYKSAEKFVSRLEDGELSIIGNPAFMEGVKTQPYDNSTSRNITQAIEYRQYLRAGWRNEIGINYNFNMKREVLTSSEVGINEDSLLELPKEMYDNRVECFDNLNSKIGTNIKVRFSGMWERSWKRLLNEIKTIEEGDNEVKG